MSKLIVEMEMPQCCWSCACCDGEYGYCAARKKPLDDPNERPDWCPIKGEISDIELMHLEEERAFAAKNIAAERKDDADS